MNESLPHSANNEASSSAAEAAIERLVDTRGISYAEARASYYGVREEARTLGGAVARRTVRTPRPNTRGGRSYNEGSDSEHDPHWNAEPQELSEAQVETNATGIANARAALRATTADTDTAQTRAIQRARKERSQRKY